MTLESFKSQFDSGSGFAHFNNAGQAPIPAVNRDAAVAWIERFRREGAHASMEAWGQVEVVRRKLARFIGADPDETAFVTTAASGLSQAAFGVPFRPGDEILTWDQEYPSNFYPWRDAAARSGARLIQVPSQGWLTPAEGLLARVTERTRAIAVSWVQYQTGSVCDLEAVSRALKGRDVWLVADVIQGVGARPFDFRKSGFDVACSGSHKWLCSGYGAGFMAVRRERMAELVPLEVGAMTYGTPDTPKSFDVAPRTTAMRYEPGSKPVVEILAMGATLDLFDAAGMDRVEREANRLAERLRGGLRDQGWSLHCESGPIVNFSGASSDRTSAACDALTAARTNFAKRGPGIRLSLHAFNRDEEVDRALDALSAAVRK